MGKRGTSQTSNKKGQVTIFIIIAIVIVVIGVLIYMFRPGIISTSVSSENPREYIRSCMIDNMMENVDLISRQGGNFEPSHYYMYEGESIDYLCYTPNYYELCQVEKPLLVSHVEKEIKDSLKDRYDECFASLVSDYGSNGYTVDIDKKDFSIMLMEDRIALITNTSVRMEKGKDIKNYEDFNIYMESGMYGLTSVAYNILNWESLYGDADVNIYMDVSNAYMIYKIKRTDGNKIYRIKDTDTNEVFQFASRSLVVAPGYGANQV